MNNLRQRFAGGQLDDKVTHTRIELPPAPRHKSDQRFRKWRDMKIGSVLSPIMVIYSPPASAIHSNQRGAFRRPAPIASSVLPTRTPALDPHHHNQLHVRFIKSRRAGERDSAYIYTEFAPTRPSSLLRLLRVQRWVDARKTSTGGGCSLVE